MSLTPKQVKQFRSIGHRLHPIIIIANGMSENIQAEIERGLEQHELIKIKVVADERAEKKGLVDEICQRHKAELVQLVGHVALLYRPARKPNPKLSNLQRHKELLS